MSHATIGNAEFMTATNFTGPSPQISIVMPYYDNPNMLQQQFKHFSGMSIITKKLFEIIIVDDGSPNSPAAAVPRENVDFPLKIFRVKVDIPWNQHGARNIGAVNADSKWLFLTDIDQIIPEDVILFMKKEIAEKFTYTFARRKFKTGVAWRSHVNTFLVTKKNFLKAGGYDEQLRGLYGTDMYFRRTMFRVAPNRHLSTTYLIAVDPDDVPDANTRTLQRRNNIYTFLKKKILIGLKERGLWRSRGFLTVPYERIV